jgi:hypothetical protein
MDEKKEITDFDVALKRDGRLVFSPHGTSMLPMLRGGQDIAVILPVDDYKLLKKYDVVFYKRDNGNFVLHRIIAVKNGYFLCCGDNQTWREKVLPEQIFGRLAGFYKDNVYTDARADKEYLKYAKRRVASRLFRKIVGKTKRILAPK